MPSALAGCDVVVDAVADHDAIDRWARCRLGRRLEGARVGLAETGEPAQALMLEQVADASARQPLARRLRLVGDDAELEATVA